MAPRIVRPGVAEEPAFTTEQAAHSNHDVLENAERTKSGAVNAPRHEREPNREKQPRRKSRPENQRDQRRPELRGGQPAGEPRRQEIPKIRERRHETEQHDEGGADAEGSEEVAMHGIR